MNIKESIYALFNNEGVRERISNYQIFTGIVTGISYDTKKATVQCQNGPQQDYFICDIESNIYYDEDNTPYIYGMYGNVNIGSFVLCVYIKKEERGYIIKPISPPESFQYNELLTDTKKGMHREPVKEDDERVDNLDEDIIKWGEYLLMSSGLAEMFFDYIGNIILESQKQIKFRIGDREDETNKIETPEITCSIGRIVDEDGEEKTDDDDKKIKYELNINDNFLVECNEEGKITVTSEADVTINSTGKTIINSTDNTEITAEGDVSISAEGNVDVEADGDVSVAGSSVKITGGSLEVDGSVAPTGSGPFCGIPNCLFTGAPHIGNTVSGT